MPNQYTDNIHTTIRERFNSSVQQQFLKYQKLELSYQDVSDILGYKRQTVNKWCKHYGIKLKKPPSRKINANKNILLFNQTSFNTKSINLTNALSKRWL